MDTLNDLCGKLVFKLHSNNPCIIHWLRVYFSPLSVEEQIKYINKTINPPIMSFFFLSLPEHYVLITEVQELVNFLKTYENSEAVTIIASILHFVRLQDQICVLDPLSYKWIKLDDLGKLTLKHTPLVQWLFDYDYVDVTVMMEAFFENRNTEMMEWVVDTYSGYLMKRHCKLMYGYGLLMNDIKWMLAAPIKCKVGREKRVDFHLGTQVIPRWGNKGLLFDVRMLALCCKYDIQMPGGHIKICFYLMSENNVEMMGELFRRNIVSPRVIFDHVGATKDSPFFMAVVMEKLDFVGLFIRVLRDKYGTLGKFEKHFVYCLQYVQNRSIRKSLGRCLGINR